MRIKRKKSDFQGDYQACQASRRAIAYIRGSTKKQELTIPMQISDSLRYAEENGFEIVSEPFIDRGISANVLMNDSAKFLNRPQAAEILARMEREQIHHLILWSVDRSSREVEDVLATIRILWEKHGITTHFAQERIVSTDPDAKQKITFYAMFAEMESTRRKARQLGTFRELREMNGRCGHHEPFGWRIDEFRKRQTRRGTASDFLVPDPTEQNTLGEILNLAAGGWSTNAIARHLNQAGMKPKGKPRYVPRSEAPGSKLQAPTQDRERPNSVPSRGIWYPSTVQSVIEHARHQDGRTCVVDKRNGRLVFTIIHKQAEHAVAA